MNRIQRGFTLLVLSMAAMVVSVAAFGGPPLSTYQRGGRISRVNVIADSGGVMATADSQKLRPLVERDVKVPEGRRRLAVITLSAVCSHTGGNPNDYTTAEAFAREHGQRHTALGGSGHDLVLCSDLGDGLEYRAAVSHTWTAVLEHDGVNHVVVRFASVGDGVAQLENVMLTVTLSKHPCSCP